MVENLSYPPIITNFGVFRGGPHMYDLVNGCTGDDPNSVFYIGDQTPPESVNDFQIQTTSNWPYCSCWHVTKSAREQVQEEILTKMAEAIEADDLKQAKKLMELAKAIKEL